MVNNAVIAGRASFDSEETITLWDRILSVNLDGTFNVSHVFVPALKAAKGCVINLCSVAGFVAGDSTAGYIISKGAVKSLTQGMARELAPHGIRVNAIAPGLIKSEMAQTMIDRPGGASWFTSRVLMGRLGETYEVVGPVVFLSSSLADFIIGSVLPVDRGFLAA
nr:SDR family oxidoreductase [Ochrobactrum sp. SFR4]